VPQRRVARCPGVAQLAACLAVDQFTRARDYPKSTFDASVAGQVDVPLETSTHAPYRLVAHQESNRSRKRRVFDNPERAQTSTRGISATGSFR
jgi:hypothetical protein